MRLSASFFCLAGLMAGACGAGSKKLSTDRPARKESMAAACSTTARRIHFSCFNFQHIKYAKTNKKKGAKNMLIFGKRKIQKLCIQAYIKPGTSVRVTPILELPIFFVKIEMGYHNDKA